MLVGWWFAPRIAPEWSLLEIRGARSSFHLQNDILRNFPPTSPSTPLETTNEATQASATNCLLAATLLLAFSCRHLPSWSGMPENTDHRTLQTHQRTLRGLSDVDSCLPGWLLRSCLKSITGREEIKSKELIEDWTSCRNVQLSTCLRASKLCIKHRNPED